MAAGVTAFLRSDSAPVISLILTYPLLQHRLFPRPVMNSALFKWLRTLTLLDNFGLYKCTAPLSPTFDSKVLTDDFMNSLQAGVGFSNRES